ncbi:hypothetical protein EON65_46390 [archaeon]|nr:MAG: hypothetical protein EON65_46390 [archaeon]
MSDRPRPPNAAGQNGLRGGIKTFAPKTITGPWLDALGGTAGYKRGFTTSEYETEAQHQQKGALLQNEPEFGAGLPDELQLTRPDSPFKYTVSKYNNENVWATNTKLMSQVLLTQSKDYEVPTALKPRMPADKLEEYRRNWTIESDAMRDVRFATETRISSSVVGKLVLYLIYLVLCIYYITVTEYVYIYMNMLTGTLCFHDSWRKIHHEHCPFPPRHSQGLRVLPSSHDREIWPIRLYSREISPQPRWKCG